MKYPDVLLYDKDGNPIEGYYDLIIGGEFVGRFHSKPLLERMKDVEREIERSR